MYTYIYQQNKNPTHLPIAPAARFNKTHSPTLANKDRPGRLIRIRLIYRINHRSRPSFRLSCRLSFSLGFPAIDRIISRCVHGLDAPGHTGLPSGLRRVKILAPLHVDGEALPFAVGGVRVEMEVAVVPGGSLAGIRLVFGFARTLVERRELHAPARLKLAAGRPVAPEPRPRRIA